MTRRHYPLSFQSSQDFETNYLTKYISDLEHKVVEKSHSPPNSTNPFLPDHPKQSKREYMEELKRQMDLKALQKQSEKKYISAPGISEDFHGYPNLPQTPKEIRRQRELDQMRHFRLDLAEQLANKQQSLNNFRAKELESAKNDNQMDYQEYLNEKMKKLAKKESEKEALVNAWNQAKKAKELRQLLDVSERKGIQPAVSKSLSNPDVYDLKKEDEASQFNLEDEIRQKGLEVSPAPSFKSVEKKLMVRARAQQIKEAMDEKEKNSYQYKIKEIVKNAKVQRGRFAPAYKQSVSPVSYKKEFKKSQYNSSKILKLR